MLLFARERLALLAVPKTGTTAWETALADHADMVLRAPPALKHMTLARFQRAVLPMVEKAGVNGVETLAVIREPEDWLGSWYRYRRRPALDGKPVSTRAVSFDAFVRAYLGEDRPAYADLGSQARFLKPAEGQRAIDHLFRHDAPETLRAFVEARLGMRVTLARKNESEPVALDLSPATRALLRRERAEDFALYETQAVS